MTCNCGKAVDRYGNPLSKGTRVHDLKPSSVLGQVDPSRSEEKKAKLIGQEMSPHD